MNKRMNLNELLRIHKRPYDDGRSEWFTKDERICYNFLCVLLHLEIMLYTDRV